MTDLYSEKVMDHFTNPRNVGEIKDADGVGQVGNPTCGDIMKMFIKVRVQAPGSRIQQKGNKSKEPGTRNLEPTEVISDIKFQTFGCGAAVASSSMVTELVKGKTLEEAEKLSSAMVAEALGGLPPIKMHCSNLGAQALEAAIKDYRKRSANGDQR